MIFHSSAILDGSSRHFLESVLQCRVVDMYGSDEAGCIAWECDTCNGYHLSSDMVILELVRGTEPALPGEEGEVLVTNLHSFAMPFIRYTQGDVAVLSTKNPQCGRGLPLLEQVVGRTDDFVVLRDGTKISPHPLYHCIDHVIGISRWRITQDSLDRITVELTLDESQRAAICDTVKKNLTTLTKEQLEINISVVDSIPIDPSSKFRAVSSRFGSISLRPSGN
jgi:phenylacetate-CoA ligase